MATRKLIQRKGIAMKTFAVALAVLGLTVSAVQADTFADPSGHGNRDDAPVPLQAEHTVEVPAGRIYSSADLANENLSPSELVTVTLIPSSGAIDNGK